jgi:hypothetical protein
VGDAGGGHYTAKCWNNISKRWFGYNDSFVTEMESAEVLCDQSAYVLFYQEVTIENMKSEDLQVVSKITDIQQFAKATKILKGEITVIPEPP